MRRRAALPLVLSAALSACAGLSPPLTPPDVAGRLALRVDPTASTPERSFSADFDLRGNAERGQLRLTGPLGATLAEVRWQPGRAELADGRGARDYPTLDAMSQDLFGESLPLLAMVDWLRGRPWAGAPSVGQADGFEQLGWRIGLAGFAQGLLTAVRDHAPAVSVRARLERPA